MPVGGGGIVGLAATNILQWNPSANNQENDTAWQTDPMRLNGAASGAVFPSPTANKLFYQLTAVCATLMTMMANKGYSSSDSNLSNMLTTLANIVTNADLPGKIVQYNDFVLNLAANHGYIKFPTATPFGGLMIQWGSGSASGGSTTYFNATFSPAFVSTPYIVFGVGIPPTRSVVYVADASEGAPGGTTNSGAYFGTGGSVCACNWFAIGV